LNRSLAKVFIFTHQTNPELMHDQTENLEPDTIDDSPPILGSWRNLYILVMVLHFIFIGLLYWFTQAHA
jgi:hypothetical protein